AEIATGLLPGRARSFGFEALPSFDPAVWSDMRGPQPIRSTEFLFHGSDRDAGAIRMARENAARASVAELTRFDVQTIENLEPPPGPPGLVIVNPPYGTRIGDRAPLVPVHRTLGAVLKNRFKGWRAGIVTADKSLAQATGLKFEPMLPAVLHGGIRVALYRTGPL